jgi:hypothetical protein
MKSAQPDSVREKNRRWISRPDDGENGRRLPAEARNGNGAPASADADARGGFAVRFVRYLYRARPFRFLTAPMLWFCILPIGFIHLSAIVFKFVCFPVFGIPFVRARDYIAMDRHRLGYLGTVAKLNCAYCGYVNGVLAYVTEIAGRTEQYWCPIKHALRLKAVHKRYAHFLDYGDAEQFRRRFERVRHDFGDVQGSVGGSGK